MIYHQRNLPHWLPEGKNLFLTWRLHGSLPEVVLAALHKNNELADGKKFLRLDLELDGAGFGPVWLKESRIASVVVSVIHAVARRHMCVVHAYAVMPNHVHMLLEPKVELRQITRAIKGNSARTCNDLLHRTGLPFWQEESYDHWVRTSASFGKIRRYIERNPVSDGLAKAPEDWEWSSAFRCSKSSTGFSL